MKIDKSFFTNILKFCSTIIFILIFILPIIILILYTLSSSWKFPEIIPSKFDLKSIEYLFFNKWNIIKSLLSSLLYSILTVLFTFLISLLPASVFARKNFKGKLLLESLLLAPAIFPSMIFSMGLHYILIILNIADSILGVVLVLSIISYPYMLRALTAGYDIIGDKYSICAKNLGAGPLKILIIIELPLLVPSIVAGSTVVFLVAFSEYFLVLLIGGGIPSFSGFLFPLLNSSERNIASMLTLIFLIIPIMLFIIIDRIVKFLQKQHSIA